MMRASPFSVCIRRMWRFRRIAAAAWNVSKPDASGNGPDISIANVCCEQTSNYFVRRLLINRCEHWPNNVSGGTHVFYCCWPCEKHRLSE